MISFSCILARINHIGKGNNSVFQFEIKKIQIKLLLFRILQCKQYMLDLWPGK